MQHPSPLPAPASARVVRDPAAISCVGVGRPGVLPALDCVNPSLGHLVDFPRAAARLGGRVSRERRASACAAG